MPAYQQINEKMVEVTLNNEEIFAKKGAMISYQGEVAFSRSFLAGQGVHQQPVAVLVCFEMPKAWRRNAFSIGSGSLRRLLSRPTTACSGRRLIE